MSTLAGGHRASSHQRDLLVGITVVVRVIAVVVTFLVAVFVTTFVMMFVVIGLMTIFPVTTVYLIQLIQSQFAYILGGGGGILAALRKGFE
jgi:uncharacterized membrane protein